MDRYSSHLLVDEVPNHRISRLESERGSRRSLAVACRMAELSKPSKGPPYNSASRQRYEPPLGFAVLGHREFDPFLLCLLRCIFAGVALIKIGDLYAFPVTS